MRKEYPELYTRDSTGKVLTWKIEVRDTLEGVKVTTTYGEYFGKKVTSSYLILQGKNLGKANETTPFEQGISEAESTINSQRKKGYRSVEDLKINLPYDENYDTVLYHALNDLLPNNRLDANDNPKPMLCQQYYRSKKDWTAPDGEIWEDRKYYYIMNPYAPKEKKAIIINFPCIIQTKINGVRCFTVIKKEVDAGMIYISQTSREGEKIEIPHIISALQKVSSLILDKFNKTELILDGELYIHGMPLQDINSCIKKPNLNTYGLVYKIFDLAIENNTNIKRVQALSIIKKLFPDTLMETFPIHIVDSNIVNNDLEVQHDTDTFINMGYEGSILRNLDGMYEFGKRPSCITKLKRPTTSLFPVIDIISQEKDPNKGLFVCRTEDGLEFEVNPKGTDEYKMLVLSMKDLFINKMLQCTFYEYTKDNKPFHIIYNKIVDE